MGQTGGPDSLQPLQPLLLHLSDMILLPQRRVQHCIAAFFLIGTVVMLSYLLLQLLYLCMGM